MFYCVLFKFTYLYCNLYCEVLLLCVEVVRFTAPCCKYTIQA